MPDVLPYEQHMFDRFTQALEGIDAATRAKIYALSLLYTTYWKEDAEGREVTCHGSLELSYNTETQYESQIENASDTEEARWNFAFWVQRRLIEVPSYRGYGEDPDDNELHLRHLWLEAQGISATGTDESGRFTYGSLDEATVQLGAIVVARLHSEGILARLFGCPIPVIIHNLTYRSEGVAATREANPPEVLNDVAAWVGGIAG
jgi:hypothetical protein